MKTKAPTVSRSVRPAEGEARYKRPPVVTVLGHVDHGKTSLLDTIRHTQVTATESGGITQHIGAYQVIFKSKPITFIDTPGHAAFSAMRARGGRAADIAVLVVAADDGVMPQTRESLQHIKTAGIPFVVAINKIDLPQAQPEKVKVGLAQEGVLVEGFGGNTPVVEVSAKTGQNVDKLLELLLLMAELEELKADPGAPLQALVIESFLDKRRGVLATLLIKEGTLHVGDALKMSSEDKGSKVKSMFDWQGQGVTEALPSTPVQVMGFNQVLPVGAILTPQGLSQTTVSVKTSAETADNVPIILKSDVQGTLEAVVGSLPAGVSLLQADTGPINESDVLLADSTGAIVIGFRVSATASAKKMAELEKVSVFTFDTIYDLLENLDQILDQARGPRVPVWIEVGRGKILQLFTFDGQPVLGTRVTSGRMQVGDRLEVVRQGEVLGQRKIVSIRVGKQDQKRVNAGTECGILVEPGLDIRPGDEVISQSNSL